MSHLSQHSHTIRPALLLASEPLLRLQERWEREIVVLKRHDPKAGATQTKELCLADLIEALAASVEAVAWVTVDQMAERIGRPTSTVRRLCQLHGATVGARKVAGAWTIDARAFAKALGSRDGVAA